MSVILLADIECITWKFHIYEIETKCARSFPLDGHNNVDDGMTDLWQTMCFGRGGGGGYRVHLSMEIATMKMSMFYRSFSFYFHFRNYEYHDY